MNEQLRFYAAELWSLVLVNNILEQSIQHTPQLTDYSKVDFENLFTQLIAFNKSILNNVSKSIEAKHGCILCIGYAIGKYFFLTKSKITNEAFKVHLKDFISNISKQQQKDLASLWIAIARFY